jgi:hypothetical protein
MFGIIKIIFKKAFSTITNFDIINFKELIPIEGVVNMILRCHVDYLFLFSYNL